MDYVRQSRVAHIINNIIMTTSQMLEGGGAGLGTKIMTELRQPHCLHFMWGVERRHIPSSKDVDGCLLAMQRRYLS